MKPTVTGEEWPGEFPRPPGRSHDSVAEAFSGSTHETSFALGTRQPSHPCVVAIASPLRHAMHLTAASWTMTPTLGSEKA